MCRVFSFSVSDELFSPFVSVFVLFVSCRVGWSRVVPSSFIYSIFSLMPALRFDKFVLPRPPDPVRNLYVRAPTVL